MADAAPREAVAPAFVPGGPWPSSARAFDGHVAIAGLTADELAGRFGTPLLVVDEHDLQERMRSMRGMFPRVAYAVKAFTSHALIRAALSEGLDLLCASGGELEACLRAGAPGARLLLHGNAKTDGELSLACETGVGLVIVDDDEELERLDGAARSVGRIQPVLLRVIPDVRVRTHRSIATGHATSKFGMPPAVAIDAARRAASLPGLRLEGYHAHAGSQVLEPEPYLRVLEILVDLASTVRGLTGASARVLDIGGGFGVAYRSEHALAINQLATALEVRMAELASERGIDRPTLIVEPGRSVVANAGVTLYRVTSRKAVGGRTLLAVDGGMSDNLRPMLYAAEHAIVAATAEAGAASERVSVVGRHCESGDVLAEDVELPAGIGRGALLAIAATGAYTYPMASSYNRFGRPAVVAVRDGLATLWLRREDAADMDRLETGSTGGERATAERPDGIDVRPARRGDAESYLALWRAVVAEGRWVRSEDVRHSVREFRRRFRRSWTPEAAEIVAVDQAGVVVGYLGLTRERHAATRHVATHGLAVAPDRRGRGVGSALLAVGFEWAASVGVDKLMLSVYPHNTQALSLYRKFGFVQEGRLSRHSRKSSGDEDELVMAAWTGTGNSES